MKVPGILYSLILAIGAWAATYFATGGAGGDYVWAPLLLAGVPIVLKMFTVATDPEPSTEPTATARGGAISQPQPGKVQRLLLG